MINPIYPTAAEFAELASILSRLADGRDALGDVLHSATGTDAGLLADAAKLRRKAATPQKFWHFVTNLSGMLGQSTQDLGLCLQQSHNAHGTYGPKIAAAATSALMAADACLAARDAQLVAARAGQDLALWFARHGEPGTKFSTIAHYDKQEAEHLSEWASKLRPETTVDLT